MLRNEVVNIICQPNNEKYNKWYNNYIEGVDLTKIEWKKFNHAELLRFIYNNYFDDEYESFVMERKDGKYFPIGMNSYLSFDKEYEKYDSSEEYLLGVVTNKKGLKTILCCMVFIPEYLLEQDGTKPVTYIETVETNKYFQGNGLFTQMIKVLPKFVDNNQNIVITLENGIGHVVGVTTKIKRILMEQGFASDVRGEYEIDEEYLTSLKKYKTKIK